MLGSSDKTMSLHRSPLVCGARRNKTLRDILVHSSIPIAPNYGKTGKSTNCCTTNNCIYCASLNTSGTITSTSLGRTFHSKKQVTCQSNNLIYCLTCKICKLQYVGQTKRTFHERVREHFLDIRKGTIDPRKPLGRHHSLPHHNRDPGDVTSHILSFITKPGDSEAGLAMRLKFERDWRDRLRTCMPHGLNTMD